jgi:hypothetical protein
VASDDSDPLADNPPYSKITLDDDAVNWYAEPRTTRQSSWGDPGTSSWSRHAIPGESLVPILRANEPGIAR